MQKPGKLLQPRSFEAFRCIGSDCEDTCCDGWGILIDRKTYAKYEQLGDPCLSELVLIDEPDRNEDHHAKIKLAGTRCPFLDEGWCSIQKRLGEENLSKTCATYPRIGNVIDDVLERSLDLSCPEAARLVLLNPDRIELHEAVADGDTSRIANLSAIDTSNSNPDKPYEYFWDIQSSTVAILQDRSKPVWQRLIAVGRGCDPGEPAASQITPAARLEIVLELILARITSDFTNRRFLDCYEEFMRGVEWTTASTMENIAAKYAEAGVRYYTPFISQHEYILENYLVSYVYKTLFPFGAQQSSHEVSFRLAERSVREHYILLAAYFAMINTVLVGMAGFHGAALNTGHAVKLIQSFSRAFEHSLKYPNQVKEILAGKGMNTGASMAALLNEPGA